MTSVHRRADILAAGPVLGVDDTLAGRLVTVAEGEVVGVDVRRGRGFRHAGDAGEVDQRIQFLDARQTPIAVPAVAQRVQRVDV